MSAAIGASRDRVWRALTQPAELIRWDERIQSLVDPADDYPRVGRTVRWRYRLGNVTILLRDAPHEVVPLQKLRSKVAVGLLHFDETFTLSEAAEPDRTRLGLKLVASNSMPVVGGLLDRFAVRQLASDRIDDRLRAIREWCERGVV